ncbi:MAG TPA: EthD family reductase [Vicinamibacterales bacterium]
MGAKLMFIVYRRADITHEQFLARWGDRQHLSFVEKTPDLIRHSHNETMQLLSGSGPDGIGELWYPNEAAMSAALASPEFAAAVEDGKRFADMEKTYAVVVREQWMIDAQQRAIEQHWAYWSAHDLDRLMSLFTDDVVYEDVTMGVVNRGRSQLRAFAEGFFSGFPDVTFELRSAMANGASGGGEWIMRGTHKGDLPGMPATGKRMEVRGSSTFEFDGEKIRRCSDYWDMATFLKQLGLMAPAAASNV